MTNEELVLLSRHCDNKSEYLEELYCQNYGLISAIAKRYSGVYELDDLMQESFLGLAEAVESYDPEGGAKFSTYATECIKFHLLNYLRDHGCSVRLPAHLQEKTRKLNKVIDDYYKVHAHEPSKTELAKMLMITQKQTEKLLAYRKLQTVKSLNEVISTDDDSIELADVLPDPVNQYEDADERMQHEQLKKVLWTIVDGLEKKQSEVIRKKYVDCKSGQQIADSMGCTVGNVRTIEHHAMRELRKNRVTKQLRPFFSDEKIYSLSLQYCGHRRFINTWTSAPEQAVLLAEKIQG